MILFCFFFSLLDQNYENFSLLAGDGIEFDPTDNTTSVLFFNQSISAILSANKTETEIKGYSFSLQQVDSITFTTNARGFMWKLNSSICSGKIYEFSTEQLLYFRTQFTKKQTENEFSCLFFNNPSPSGKLTFSLFGDQSEASLYTYDDNNTLQVNTTTMDSAAKGVLFDKPFFIQIGTLETSSQFFIDLSLDIDLNGVDCISEPIQYYYGLSNFTSEFSYVQSTLACTNQVNYKEGWIAILFILVVLILIIVVFIVVKITCNKEEDKKQGENREKEEKDLTDNNASQKDLTDNNASQNSNDNQSTIGNSLNVPLIP